MISKISASACLTLSLATQSDAYISVGVQAGGDLSPRGSWEPKTERMALGAPMPLWRNCTQYLNFLPPPKGFPTSQWCHGLMIKTSAHEPLGVFQIITKAGQIYIIMDHDKRLHSRPSNSGAGQTLGNRNLSTSLQSYGTTAVYCWLKCMEEKGEREREKWGSVYMGFGLYASLIMNFLLLSLKSINTGY